MKISHFIVLTFVVFGIYKTYEILNRKSVKAYQNENQNQNQISLGSLGSLGGLDGLKGESAPDNSAYIEVLDWTNDEYWEIQELNGKYYRVLDDGAFEEMGVYEEYEYEEEIGDIEDLYKYAQENKSRIVKAIKKP